MPDFEFPDSFELCCGGKKCPIIHKTEQGFTISDEGKAISMTDAQAEELKRFIETKLNLHPV